MTRRPGPGGVTLKTSENPNALWNKDRKLEGYDSNHCYTATRHHRLSMRKFTIRLSLLYESQGCDIDCSLWCHSTCTLLYNHKQRKTSISSIQHILQLCLCLPANDSQLLLRNLIQQLSLPSYKPKYSRDVLLYPANSKKPHGALQNTSSKRNLASCGQPCW